MAMLLAWLGLSVYVSGRLEIKLLPSLGLTAFMLLVAGGIIEYIITLASKNIRNRKKNDTGICHTENDQGNAK